MDMKNRMDVVASINPAAQTSTVNGSGVALANFSEVMVVFIPGAISDGTHTPKLQESADNSNWSDVAAADMVGTLSNLASNTIQRVSYIGSKDYVRPVVTVSGATNGGVYGAAVIRSGARKQPVA